MAPSEDLVDEAEAINAIYGVGTLVWDEDASEQADATTAVLALPTSSTDIADPDDPYATAHRLRLRLSFPAAYPAGPDAPTVRGVQSIGDAGSRRPGAATGEVDRFRAAVAEVFQAGAVCLFDAIEGYLQAEDADEDEAEEEGRRDEQPRPEPEVQIPRHLQAPPPWTVAAPLIELKSVFVARCAPVTSPAQAADFLQHLMATDRRVRTATHNMTAWRIRSDGAATFQDCNDDGETAAGGRLLHLMQLMDLWDVMVVVTRWYGGHKLGPRRFALINQAARDAFVQAGLVAVPAKKKHK